MVAPQSDELQSAFFDRLDPKLAGDGRIRAAWLEASFGRGDADRYMDLSSERDTNSRTQANWKTPSSPT